MKVGILKEVRLTMKVGILKEIKVLEKRVCMVPASVATMVANCHEVMVEKAAGTGAGFPDAEYVVSSHN